MGGYGVGKQKIVLENTDGTSEDTSSYVRRLGEKLKPLFEA
jgi:hypothetical protein